MTPEASGLAIILIIILSLGGALFEAFAPDPPAPYYQDGSANGVFPFQ